jgi:hypothetical protein
MARPTAPSSQRPLELIICEAIASQRILVFDYAGHHRVVQPYCHGFTSSGAESLRAIQVKGGSRSGNQGDGKLWTIAMMQNLRMTLETFVADDPVYNPDDSAMVEIHCRVALAPQAHRRR